MSDGVITGALETVSMEPFPSAEARKAALFQLLMTLDEVARKHHGPMTTSTIRGFFEKLEYELKEAAVPPDSEFAVKFSHPALSNIREAIRALKGLEVGDKPHSAFERQKPGSAALSLAQANQDDIVLAWIDDVRAERGHKHWSKAAGEVAAALKRAGITRKEEQFSVGVLRGLHRRKFVRQREKNQRVASAD
jgi:hypothetical protein